MTTAASTDLRSSPARRPLRRALRAADQAVADASGVPPLRQHQARLRRPVATLHRLVQRLGLRSLRRNRDRCALPGRPRRFRRQHCYDAAGRQRYRQGP